MTGAGQGSAATLAGTRGAVDTLEVGMEDGTMEVEVGTMEEVDGTMEEVTITTSLAPVLLTSAGGREVLRRLPGPPIVEVVNLEMEDGVEDLADTQAITTVMEMEVQASTPATTTEVTEEGDVSE